MAEQSKQVPQDLGEENKRHNRQINYFIMRYMWQVVCKRGTGRIYEAFGMSRERYTRIINTGKVRLGKAELSSLQQRTGLREEVFTGAIRFDCSYMVEKDGKKVEHSISDEQWNDLFKWKEEPAQREDDCQTENSRRDKAIQNSICKELRKVERNNKENWDFYRLCYFLRERKPAPLKAADVTVRDIENQIRGLTFELLDRCDIGHLQGLQKLLKEKSGLVNGIATYKRAKEASKEI